ncbi:Rid family hydrolase [Ancylobacter sp. FA202]|uniref:Rid family hydrolase n=1 Tax=Ancylobacter sp. FA202 TaxID=1111106 RepID=UPI00037B264B|nr:RidA family protein [Ancylobacter sp. FA202]
MAAPDFRAIEVPVLSQAIRDLGVPLSLVVEARGFLFISGIPPIDVATGQIVSGDIATQCNAALKALKACLEAAGETFESVVSTKIYAANAGHYAAVNAVYREHFQRHLPARTFIAVGSWPGAFDLEIECVAVRTGGEPRG